MSVARYTLWLGISGAVALVILSPFISGGPVVVALAWLVLWFIGIAWILVSARTRPALAVAILIGAAALVVFVIAPSVLGLIWNAAV
jgi:hypothetical protein